MFRPFLRVARPADWTGLVAVLVTGLFGVVLLLASLMARLPQAWVEAASGHAIAVRAVLVVISFWVVAWVRALVYSRLPAAPYLVGRHLAVPTAGETRHLKVDEVRAIHVEQRVEPNREMFVLDLRDGSALDLCPTHWKGAGRLYAGLAKKIR